MQGVCSRATDTYVTTMVPRNHHHQHPTSLRTLHISTAATTETYRWEKNGAAGRSSAPRGTHTPANVPQLRTELQIERCLDEYTIPTLLTGIVDYVSISRRAMRQAYAVCTYVYQISPLGVTEVGVINAR